MLLLED